MRKSVDEVLAELKRSQIVEYAEPDYMVRALDTVPDDPRYPELWGLQVIGAPEAWDRSTGGPATVVGVIDTGVDYTHEDLTANMWRNPGEIENGLDDDGNGYVDDIFGINCITGSGDPYDDNRHGHGTHVAGTIGAVGDNGTGVVGVNWDVQIMALKFLDSTGSGTVSDAIECLEYAVDMRTRFGVNVRLTNNSWGGGGFSQALYEAIQASGDADMLFVAAAGNDEGNDNDVSPRYPSSFDHGNIIAVAATDQVDELAYFSNLGAASVDLAAPGVDILSSVPGHSYAELDGTSMATPHVSGAAARIWSEHPDATARGVKALILDSVDPVPALDGRVLTGGRLNVANAFCEPGDYGIGMAPGSGFSIESGNEMAVEVELRDCLSPVTAASVMVRLSNGNQPFDLLDDGVMPDAVAGDGTYTAFWTPNRVGSVTLNVEATFGDALLEESISGNIFEVPNYVLSDDIPFSWVDAAVGTDAQVSYDDRYAEIPIGFEFEFYGVPHDAVKISSNGYLTFGSAGAEHRNSPVPGVSAPTDLIAPYWDDLNSSWDGGVFYLLEGTAPQRRLTIAWVDVPYYDEEAPTTFEVTLYEADGRIVFQYLDVSSGAGAYGGSATIGIQDASGSDGLQYSHNEPVISNGLAIEFIIDDDTSSDFDGDGVEDEVDNCPFAPNPLQEDSGGLGFQPPDGIGDACQCGDVTGDGIVNSFDATMIKRQALGLSAPLFNVPDHCDVTDDGSCNSFDATVVKRAAIGLTLPPLLNSCPNFTGGL